MIAVSRVINVSLSSDGIKRLCDEMRKYERSLPDKTKRFMELLADVGIQAAQEALSGGTHTMPDRITLTKEVEIDGNKVTLAIIGEGSTFVSEWVDALGGEHTDVVYPMHMMEFGSAGYAEEPSGDFGASVGGKGTFSKMGHQDAYAWYFNVKSEDGEKTERKLGTAIRPTRPLYTAMERMKEQIQQAAKEAFGGE